jgi:predicted DNA-binding transcriptional regulator YafY
MESDSGYGIELIEPKNSKHGRDRYYRYKDEKFSINKKDLNASEAAQLKEALLILSRFKGMQQFEWVDETVAKLESSFGLKKGAEKIIGFDENKDYTAVVHISTLFNKILNAQAVTVKYKSFRLNKEMDIILHPYYLKQYNNRWFCFGWNQEENKISNLALDRIVSIKDKKLKYRKNTEIDFNDDYFEEVIGVTVNGECRMVKLKVYADLWPYIESKPIHHTQTELKAEKTKDYRIITIEVKLNYELESLLLSHGNRIEVLEPEDLRNSLIKKSTKIQ